MSKIILVQGVFAQPDHERARSYWLSAAAGSRRGAAGRARGARHLELGRGEVGLGQRYADAVLFVV